MPQIQKALKIALGVKSDDENPTFYDETSEALDEVREAVLKFNEIGEEIELSPRPIEIRKQQHDYIEQHGLKGISLGESPNRRIKIIKQT